jgi:glycosyltransferase involved in cell wall biosynthesis
MGNSNFHGHVYELLRQRPGAVVAHDVRLTGFYGWFSGQERPEDPASRLAERIEAQYGQRLPPTAGEQSPSWERQAALGVYMTREIQEYAELLFVHSRYARDVLELDRGILDRRVPIEVMPFGMSASQIKARRCIELGDSPLIISVGVVSEVKGLSSLIAAVSLVARERERTRLVIAGPAERDELERWRTFARETAPQIDVEIPGHLPADRYASLLERADVAVQLRTLSNGEASAAVSDCLTAGLPTIATDLGWVSELPPTAVSLVPLNATDRFLADRLNEIIDSRETRQILSDKASAHARACSFAHVAEEYIRALRLA